MTKRERLGWLTVASLFVTLFLIFGSGYNTAGVFVTPLIKEFGWKRAKISFLQSLLAASAGFSGPLIGWLLGSNGSAPRDGGRRDGGRMRVAAR